MKNWAETREVLDRLRAVLKAGLKAAVCTIIGVEGSTYRRAGAKLLVVEDGTSAGNISGGCLEQDMREVALQVIRSGRGEVRRYCSGTEEGPWGLGLGCDGRIDILIAPAPEFPRVQRRLLDRGLPFALATMLPAAHPLRAPAATTHLVVMDGATNGTLGAPELDAAVAISAREFLISKRSAVESFGDYSVFIESLVPPPRLVVFGAGEDARPLSRLASDVGFRVVVTDKRPAALKAEWFPIGTQLVSRGREDFETTLALDQSCYAVVMSHNYLDDVAAVRLLLASPVPYIGVLGPRRRTQRILGELEAEGSLDEAQQGRIYGPAGLDIGAEGAEQVAISIVAEALGVYRERTGRPLRDRRVPIHAVDA